MKIIVDATYMIHSGGTKFYEVISYSNERESRHASVRRWGKIGVAGQSKVDYFNSRAQLSSSANEVVTGKVKHDYIKTFANFGIHKSKSFESSIGRLTLGEHYDDLDIVDALAIGLRLNDGIAGDDALVDDYVESAPAPAPARDGNWGSW